MSLVLAARLAMESLGSGLSPADSRHSGPHGSQLVGGRGLESYPKESYLRRGAGTGKKLIMYHLINFKLQPR